MRPEERTRQGTAGFALLELIIAAALSATVLAVIAHTLTRAAQLHARQVVRSELTQNGQVALDRITRELRMGGAPTLEPDAISFPVDTNGDDVFDALLRFEKSGDQLHRRKDADAPQVLAEKIASVSFAGADLTTIRLDLEQDGETVKLQTAVRHAN